MLFTSVLTRGGWQAGRGVGTRDRDHISHVASACLSSALHRTHGRNGECKAMRNRRPENTRKQNEQREHFSRAPMARVSLPFFFLLISLASTWNGMVHGSGTGVQKHAKLKMPPAAKKHASKLNAEDSLAKRVGRFFCWFYFSACRLLWKSFIYELSVHTLTSALVRRQTEASTHPHTHTRTWSRYLYWK